MNVKHLAKTIGITIGFGVLLLVTVIAAFSFFLGFTSELTANYGLAAAILTVPFVYVIVDEYRTWLRG